MSSLLPAPDSARFVARLLVATKMSHVKWESASPYDDSILVADLGQNYSVRLSLVPDFTGDTDADPDHLLEVMLEGKQLFQLDRREVQAELLSTELGQETEFTYQVFAELWSRARLVASHAEDHLNAVNNLLGEKIGPS